MTIKKPASTAKRLPSSSLKTSKKPTKYERVFIDVMLDPRYLRQSSALVQEALRKGFDVLQHSSGDIVTTMTKDIIQKYSWDTKNGKLVKAKSDADES